MPSVTARCPSLRFQENAVYQACVLSVCQEHGVSHGEAYADLTSRHHVVVTVWCLSRCFQLW